MKKFLQLLALLLTLAMILPMIPVMTFAQTQQGPITNADGTTTYYATEHKTAVADGTIGADEYSVTANLSPVVVSSNASLTNWLDLESEVHAYRSAYISEEMSVSFSSDEENIYIAVKDKSGTASDAQRNGYAIRLGFDEERPEYFVGFYLQCVNFTSTDGSKTNAANELRYDDGAWPQAGYRGMVRLDGNILWNIHDKESGDLKYSEATKDIYPVTGMTVVREDVDGDISLGTAGRISSGQHYTYYEISLSKEKLLKFYNYQNPGDTAPSGFVPVSDVDTMLFSIAQRETNKAYANVIWGGSLDEGYLSASEEDLAAYSLFKYYNYDRVIFPKADTVSNERVSTHDSSLTQYGQNIYSTGDADYTPTSKMKIDGVLGEDEGWVCVTPNYVDKYQVSSYVNGASNRGWWGSISNKATLAATNTYDDVWALASDYKYYVAQDDNYVYIAFQEDVPYLLTPVGTNNYVTINPSHSYYFRLGFNPNDYKQQLVLSSDVDIPVVTGLAANDFYKTDIDFSAFNEQVTISGKEVTRLKSEYAQYSNTYGNAVENGSWTKITELKLEKAAITAAYEAAYGEENTYVDFNTIFVGVSVNAASNSDTKNGEYKGNNGGTWTGNVLRALYGAFQTSTSSENRFIPDAIVFGEKNIDGCSFTTHATNDRYKVPGTDNTYYHSCAHCGAAGAKTFTVDANGSIFDREVTSEAATVVAHDACITEGTYLRSCSCGRVDTDKTNVFTYSDPHVYVEKVSEHIFKEPTCTVGGIYYKVCDVCGAPHATETFVVNDSTVWPTGVARPIHEAQRVFYTGTNYRVDDGDIDTTDWTPIDSDLKRVNTSTIYGVAQNQNNQENGSIITGADVYKDHDYNDLFTKFDYYAAKSDTTMYLSFAQLYDYNEKGVNGCHSVVTWGAQVYRIGFNKYDYTQQLVINVPGHGGSSNSLTIGYADADGYTQIYSGGIKNMATGINNALADKIPEGINLFAINPGTPGEAFNGDIVAVQDATRIHNFRFNLEGIKTLWAVCFGTELDDSDLDAVYASITHQVYTGGAHRTYAYYGSLLPNDVATEAGLSQLYPDLIVFGGHNEVVDIEGTAPTCTEAGVANVSHCSVCNEVLSNGEALNALGHEVVNDKAKDATCSETGLTAGKHCYVCGEVLVAQETVDKLDHTPGDTVVEKEVEATCKDAGSYDNVVYCTVCEAEISRETVTTDKLDHTPAAAVVENEVKATCTATGSYDSVIYCSVCNTELDRDSVTTEMVAHTPAEAVVENTNPASCGEAGSYDSVIYCSVCEAEINRETKTIDKLPHTPAEAVVENEVKATCTATGSYDSVIYCSVCNEELNRVAQTIDKIAHTPAEAVVENATDSTCTVAGSYDEVVYCSVCNAELSRETKAKDLAAHTPAEAAVENKVDATCTAAGSYEEVVYCTVCKAELSRETKTIDKLAHTYVDVQADKYFKSEEDSVATYYKSCSVCEASSEGDTNETFDVEVAVKVGDSYFNTLEEAVEAAEEGDTIILADDCTAEAIMVPVGVTLDLNGKTLKVESFNAFGDVVDGTMGGESLLIVAIGECTLESTNSFLPVYDTTGEESGYRFYSFELPILNKEVEGDSTKTRFGVRLTFANDAAYEIIESGDAGLEIGLRIEIEGYDAFEMTYRTQTLKDYVALMQRDDITGTPVMAVTISGLNKLDAGTTIKAYTTVRSTTSVSAIGDVSVDLMVG